MLVFHLDGVRFFASIGLLIDGNSIMLSDVANKI